MRVQYNPSRLVVVVTIPSHRPDPYPLGRNLASFGQLCQVLYTHTSLPPPFFQVRSDAQSLGSSGVADPRVRCRNGDREKAVQLLPLLQSATQPSYPL